VKFNDVLPDTEAHFPLPEFLKLTERAGCLRDNKKFLLILFLTGFAVFIWSAIHPKDRFTWVLEVMPVLVGVPLLFLTRKRFPLTRLVYALIWIHAILLMIGGHYTYAEMPLFNWIRDTFHLSRNHYDRLGHFAQGFIPAMIAREILLRRSPLRPGGWLFYIVVSICLAISAAYELLEWAVSAMTGSRGNAFLGTQGDIWDTQKDMALALCGSILAQLFLQRKHDQELQKL
jgi:putative membrane protein